MAPLREQVLALLESRDPDMMNQGIELIRSMDDPALYTALLSDAAQDPRGRLYRRSRHGAARWLLPLLLTCPPGTRLPGPLRPERLTRLEIQWPLPPEVHAALLALPRLRALSVRASQGTVIDGLGALPELRELALSYGVRVGPDVAALRRLWRLDCRSLPAQTAALRRLSHVTIRDASTPLDALASLPALERLELVGVLPAQQLEALAHKHSLRHLRLQRSRLEAMPPALLTLSALEVLDLSDAPLAQLPDRIDRLGALRVLRLDRTRLRRLPQSIGALSALEELSIEHTPLREVPDSIGDLSALRVLRLGHGRLQALPPALWELPDLRALHLADNHLRYMPHGRLHPHLERLSLSGNRLDHLPHHCLLMPRLRELRMANNQISAIVKPVRTIQQLQRLDLRGNRLGRIPSWISDFPGLVSLDLGRNRLVGLPDAIGSLAALQSLWLDHNPLRSLPDSLDQLSLQHLSLCGALRGQVPDVIGRLSTLRQLDLRDGGLTAVPPVLAKLSGLDRLDLRHNPLDPEKARATLAAMLPRTTVRL